ncbi:MAG: hypothetical protein EHM45_11455 [Desulfobacteraceae bacterium]|nr:MAG: hypothetical protein EHM45_11455 [Desulfobacteraceae bacterium]
MPDKLKAHEILRETLAYLQFLYKQEGLQPGALQNIGLKPQWTVLIGTDHQCGMAINFTGKHQVYDIPEPDLDLAVLKTLIGRNLTEVASANLDADSLPMRAIGLAALSALSQPFLTPTALAKRGFLSAENRHFLNDLITPRDIVTVIGFGGLIRSLLGKCKELHVTDMRPRESFINTVIGQTVEYGPLGLFIHGEKENEAVVKKSDVVVITGSTLVNRTFDELMSYTAHARTVGLYGPTAGLIPDLFFKNNIDFILSHWVKDPARFAYDMANDIDMEFTLRTYQNHQVIWKPKGVKS